MTDVKKSEVFQLRDGWHLMFNGMVPVATWQERGPAEAQLALLKAGYSVLTDDGCRIKHVGARSAEGAAVMAMYREFTSVKGGAR